MNKPCYPTLKFSIHSICNYTYNIMLSADVAEQNRFIYLNILNWDRMVIRSHAKTYPYLGKTSK